MYGFPSPQLPLPSAGETALQVIIAIKRYFLFIYLLISGRTLSVQRSKIHADKKIKGCSDYQHLWPMENKKPVYSAGDNFISGITILVKFY